MQRGHISLFIFLFFVLIIVSIFLIRSKETLIQYFNNAEPEIDTRLVNTPTPTPMPREIVLDPERPGWKIFIDKTSGFQYSYPEDLVGDIGNLAINYNPESIGLAQKTYLGTGVYKIYLDENSSEFQLEGLNRLLDKNIMKEENKIKLKYLTIDGYPAVNYIQNPKEATEEIPIMTYLIKRDELSFFTITFGYDEPNFYNQHLDQVNEIISSFKFLPLPSASPVTFIPYTSKKLGFSFLYPDTWDLKVEESEVYNYRLRQYENLFYIELFDSTGEKRIIFANFSIPNWTCQNGGFTKVDDVIIVNNQEVKLSNICNKSGYFFQNKEGERVFVGILFVGDLAEKNAQEIFKSINGLSVIS